MWHVVGREREAFCETGLYDLGWRDTKEDALAHALAELDQIEAVQPGASRIGPGFWGWLCDLLGWQDQVLIIAPSGSVCRVLRA